MRDDRDTWLDPVLTEYSSMRTESMTSMQTQQSTLSFGTATLGFVAASAFGLMKDELSAFTPVFVIGVPLLSLLVVIVWFGEVARMMRVGRRLEVIEGIVNDELVKRGAPRTVFTWEMQLRTARRRFDRQFCFSNYAVIALFAGIAAASILFGLYQTGWSEGWFAVSAIGLGLVAGGLILLVVGVRRISRPANAAEPDERLFGRRWRRHRGIDVPLEEESAGEVDRAPERSQQRPRSTPTIALRAAVARR